MMSTRSSLKRKFDSLQSPTGDSTAAVSTSSSTHTGLSASMAGDYSTGYALANPQTMQGADNMPGLTSSPMPDVMESDENLDGFDFSGGPPHVPTQQVKNVGNLTSMHGSRSDELDVGYRSYYTIRRKLRISNDDVAELEGDISSFVTHLYEHITITPVSMDQEQKKMVERFEKKLKVLGRAIDQQLANVSSMIVTAIIRLHTKGDWLYASQFKALKPMKDDSTMTAKTRFYNICDRVKDHKKHAIDLMEGGADAITKFVAAPLGATRRKKAYKANNDQRAEKFKMAKAGGLAGGAGSSEEGNEGEENEGEENEGEENENDGEGEGEGDEDENEENEDEEDD